MHIVQAKRHRGLLRVNFENHFLLTLHCTLLSSYNLTHILKQDAYEAYA